MAGAAMAMRRWLLVGLAGAVLGAAPAAVEVTLFRLKAGAAEEDVAAALREARALALSRGRAVRVQVDERLRSVSVEGGRWRRLPDGVSLAGPPPDRDGRGIIVFAPDGSSSGGQIVVSWRDRAVSLLVDELSGGVRRVRAGPVRLPGAGVRPGTTG